MVFYKGRVGNSYIYKKQLHIMLNFFKKLFGFSDTKSNVALSKVVEPKVIEPKFEVVSPVPVEVIPIPIVNKVENILPKEEKTIVTKKTTQKPAPKTARDIKAKIKKPSVKKDSDKKPK